MAKRRDFLKAGIFSSLVVATNSVKAIIPKGIGFSGNNGGKPLVISTWNHGLAANEEAWKILEKGGKSIDAVEKGVMIPEADPNVRSVGYGGYPDRDGHVTLDASIMDDDSSTGAVSFL